ncbi:LmeA family phospholipid-binding protein [Pseudarthrobacter sp. WHRI 8279]|uniref:LmeA family phospholipid-binding protein n=1 Tax=Pseudarthrobacter sp. WHRI 8279 TaxID=3162566 RepID=UPI0032EE1931
MEWTRAKDWLIGAVGMVLALGVAAAIAWWIVSDPASGVEAAPAPTPTPGERQPDPKPPAGLGADEVWLGDVALDAGTLAAAGSVLHDVRAIGQDVVTGPDGMAAERLTVDATVPFEVVASELGDGTEVRAAGGGQVMVVRTVEALGRQLAVTATGTVEADAGRLVVEPRSIDFGGPGFVSDAVGAVVNGLVTIEHDIEGLPEGLVLQEVTVQEDGFRARLSGENVKLGP